jgi:thiol:disulfide interchange protein DsbD
MKVIDMSRLYVTGILLFVLTISYAGPGEQQSPESEEILSARLILPAKKLAKQDSYPVLVELNIAEDWHINSNQPLEDFLIPTEVKFDEAEAISFGKIRYMDPELRKFTFSDTKMSVYEGKVYVYSTVTISPNISTNEIKISGQVFYQACNDESCLAPAKYYFAALAEVNSSGAEDIEINKDIFDSVLPLFEDYDSVDNGNEVSDVIEESGLFYAFLFIFLGGLALNLTPCVYPLIPITISYFGGQSEGNKTALILRAVVYVLGMSVTYSILGVLAALTGSLLGSALQNPFVLIFVALVMVGLALSMFGLYEIRVPQSLAVLGSKNRSGYLGTLFMGLTVGLIAAPCIGPFVLGLLTYVSEIGDPLLGFWMFFVLALGLGTPFLILGIFSGAASRLPRSGAWMVWVRNIFGFILLGMAIYFLEPLFPGETVYYLTLAILALIAGIYVGWLDKNKGSRAFQITRYSVGVLFILIGVYFMLPTQFEQGEHISWTEYSAEKFAAAVKTEKPVIIDFYADWCIPCKELEKFTFSDKEVINKSKEFITIKADLTSFHSDETNKLRNQFDIRGVPTIVFIDRSGNEIKNLRLTGFEDADQFLKRMNKAGI